MTKPKKFKKIKKFFRDPNLFFYDMFRKRVFNGAPMKEAPQATSLKSAASSSVDIIEAQQLGLANYIRKNIKTGYGPIDGCDPNSLLLWSGYLISFLSLIASLKSAMSLSIQIYTLGGGYNRDLGAQENLDINVLHQTLSTRSDFVIEMSNVAGELCVLRTYLYDIAKTGLATVRSNKAWIRRFPHSELGKIFKSGLVDARATHGAPIDAVYTWVNHADRKWQSYWRSAFPEESFDPDRYTSNDELRYSLRSLNKYAPWLRKIFIVSNCSRPAWLKDDGKIVWVWHEEIFPDQTVLPTFNSHAIETCLHRIKGISENFIYLNDDFVLGQPCLPADFFDEIGRSIAYFEPYGMVDPTERTEGLSDYLVAAKNSRKLIKQEYPAYNARNLHRHVPYALKKSILAEIERKFSSAFQITREAKRRSINDINLTSFLYHHYAYAKGLTVKGDASSIIVRPNNIEALTSNDSYKYKLLCFNDGDGSSTNSAYKRKSLEFFSKRLAEPARWEQSASAIY